MPTVTVAAISKALHQFVKKRLPPAAPEEPLDFAMALNGKMAVFCDKTWQKSKSDRKAKAVMNRLAQTAMNTARSRLPSFFGPFDNLSTPSSSATGTQVSNQ
uniref:Uncharacterized protein n=1 Tax=Panagrellus redivivus TaxID=6233 RepID=A0A7E4VTT1_PANRE